MRFIESALAREIFKRGYTIRGFCLKAGLDRNTIYKWFYGKTKKLTATTYYKIATALNLSLEETIELCER